MIFSSGKKKRHLLSTSCIQGSLGTAVTQRYPCGLSPTLSSRNTSLCFLFLLQVTECLTTVKSVNKTDSQTLLTTFGVRKDSCDLAGISITTPFQGGPHPSLPIPCLTPFLPPLPSHRTSPPSGNILDPWSAGAGGFVLTSPDPSLPPSSVSGTAHSCISGRSGLVPGPGAPEGKNSGNGLRGRGRRGPQIYGTPDPKVLRFQKSQVPLLQMENTETQRGWGVAQPQPAWEKKNRSPL